MEFICPGFCCRFDESLLFQNDSGVSQQDCPLLGCQFTAGQPHIIVLGVEGWIIRRTPLNGWFELSSRYGFRMFHRCSEVWGHKFLDTPGVIYIVNLPICLNDEFFHIKDCGWLPSANRNRRASQKYQFGSPVIVAHDSWGPLRSDLQLLQEGLRVAGSLKKHEKLVDDMGDLPANFLPSPPSRQGAAASAATLVCAFPDLNDKLSRFPCCQKRIVT